MKALFEYLLLVSVIMASGNPVIIYEHGDIAAVVLFLISTFMLIFGRNMSTTSSVSFLYVIVLLLLIQGVIFGNQVTNASIKFFLHVFIGFALAFVMPRLLQRFVHCMFLLSISSLFFYFVFWLPDTADVLRPYELYVNGSDFSIGLHTFRGRGYDGARNSGAFWEPGAFAGYLAIALFCMVLASENKRQSLVIASTMIVALITTFSTMGYMALLVVVIAYFVQKFRYVNPVFTFLILPALTGILLFGAWTVAQELPFLQEKIETQYEEAAEGEEYAEVNRIGNALYDLEFIKLRPWFGWSANVETRIKEDPGSIEFIERQGNALTGMAVRFGIVGWILFMSQWFFGFKRASANMMVAMFGVSTIAVTLVGEKYLNFPLIMCFFFLQRYHSYPEKLLESRRYRRKRSPFKKLFSGARKFGQKRADALWKAKATRR